MTRSGWAVIVTAAAAVVAGCATGTPPEPPAATGAPPAATAQSPHSGAAGDREALAAGSRCGTERWSVKTGSDPDVGLINLSAQPTSTTITVLDALPAPNPLPPDNRVRPVETTIYTVRATLTGFKQESDSDYHLVLSDGGHTMIAELASPLCTQPDPLRADIASARSAFDTRFHPGPSFQHVNVPVTVTGVGFFDTIHGQAGVAPNGIELHPVLSITFG